MTASTTDAYVMGRTPQEYERLRQQARIWEGATASLLDRASLGPGSRCLDVGCGPGETMRLMAERVGPTGQVVGLDTDADIGRAAVMSLHAAGLDQCTFVEGDVAGPDPFAAFPDAFDLVFGRLILLHVADPVAVLRRMWAATAPGGHLVVQDYDLRTVDCYPPLRGGRGVAAGVPRHVHRGRPRHPAGAPAARPLRGGGRRPAGRHRGRRAARAPRRRRRACSRRRTAACRRPPWRRAS